MPPAPKRAVNLTLSRALVEEAKALEINLSREFERHLAELVKQRHQDQWLAQNRPALEAYNAHIEKDGVFSAGLRGF